jgi:hypothetical protein
MVLLLALTMLIVIAYPPRKNASAQITCQWMYQMDCGGYLIKNCDGSFTNTGHCFGPGHYVDGCTPCQ